MALDLNGSTGVSLIQDGAVVTADLAASSVTTAKIADAAVTPAKMSQPLTQATAKTTTSGTEKDFPSIPSWAKRITVVFNGVSLSGTANILVQVGNSTPTTSGYTGVCPYNSGGGGVGVLTSTAGFPVQLGVASYVISGTLTITNVSGNTWVASGVYGNTTTTAYGGHPAGVIALGSALDMVRITTTNGTDTFDAGSVNIIYE